jgi:uroporphyrin-III C-methyltransferase
VIASLAFGRRFRLTKIYPNHSPRVTLVGAGPGAADLRALTSAEIVVHDALVGEDILGLIPEHARKINVGKRGHRASTAQSFINKLLISLAKSGKTIVRLKGGDPSIFGRASEEMAALESAGIYVDIVPGITTASAAAAQFGFSLTKRGIAQQVLFLTGRTALGTQTALDAACDASTTLCLYMGCADSLAITQALIALGRSPSTPALIARNVGRANASVRVTSLQSLPVTITRQQDDGPGLIVIGEVCRDARDHNDLVQTLSAQVA